MSRKLKLALASSVLSAFFAFGAASACPGHESQAKAEEKAAPTGAVTTAMFKVEGMHCEGCADNIKTALNKAGGVVKVEVKTADHKVIVTFEKDKITAEKISKMINDAGYKAAAEV